MVIVSHRRRIVANSAIPANSVNCYFSNLIIIDISIIY